MAHALKDRGYDAVPVGHDKNSQDTIDMLSDWADRIIVMQPRFASGILKRNAHKVVPPELTDVGMDRWGAPLDLGLQERVNDIIDRLERKGYLRK